MTRKRLRTGLYVLAGCALLAGTAFAARRFAPRPRSEVRVYMVVLSDVPGNAVELPAAVGRAKVTPVRTTDIDERDGKVVLSVHVDQPQRPRKARRPLSA